MKQIITCQHNQFMRLRITDVRSTLENLLLLAFTTKLKQHLSAAERAHVPVVNPPEPWLMCIQTLSVKEIWTSAGWNHIGHKYYPTQTFQTDQSVIYSVCSEAANMPWLRHMEEAHTGKPSLCLICTVSFQKGHKEEPWCNDPTSLLLKEYQHLTDLLMINQRGLFSFQLF